jgi:exosome complex exonuclease RRP6
MALDLEHDAARSYLGVTCLLQISLDDGHDYVIDTLALFDAVGPALRPAFADPEILKVLHGADRDVEWLQRDFGLYLVGLLDTHQLAKLLPAFDRRRLDSVVNRYVLSAPLKKEQGGSDWTRRPLSPVQLRYARLDTRYLLFAAAKLWQEVASTTSTPTSQSEVLLKALDASAAVARRVWRHAEPRLDAVAEAAISRTTVRLLAGSRERLAALLRWAELAARKYDLGRERLAPTALLIDLANAAPTTATAVLKIAGGRPHIAVHAQEVAAACIAATSDHSRNPVQAPSASTSLAADSLLSQSSPSGSPSSSFGRVFAESLAELPPPIPGMEPVRPLASALAAIGCSLAVPAAELEGLSPAALYGISPISPSHVRLVPVTPPAGSAAVAATGAHPSAAPEAPRHVTSSPIIPATPTPLPNNLIRPDDALTPSAVHDVELPQSSPGALSGIPHMSKVSLQAPAIKARDASSHVRRVDSPVIESAASAAAFGALPSPVPADRMPKQKRRRRGHP